MKRPHMSHLKTVTNNLAAIRNRVGLHQGQLATDVGTVQKSICAYEQGSLMPRLDTALRIAHRLGVTVDEIWSLTEMGSSGVVLSP